MAAADPDWLTEHADPEWFERYGKRIEDQRLPKGKEARKEYMKTVGVDGQKLLAEIDAPSAPQDLAGLAEIKILREVWEQWYIQDSNGELRARDPKEMPEGAHLIQTPCEVEARYSSKRQSGWVGYKVHLTESCDEGLPSLITGVHTTPATGTDVKQLSDIQEGLASSAVLPSEQLADAAYVSGDNLLASHARNIDLIGPAYQDKGWQAKAGEGFDVSNFQVDWSKKVVRCPEGKESVLWSETKTARKRNMSRVIFDPADCATCPSRSLCTRDKSRSLTLQPQAEHEAIQSARRRQKTEEFTEIYSQRAGIEGTVSQGVRSFGLRQARYRGQKRTHLQQLSTAAAVNVSRVSNWINGVPIAATRRSHLEALTPAC